MKLGNKMVEQSLRGLSHPYAEQVQKALAGWRDPRAKAIRKRKQATAVAQGWGVTTAATGIGAAVVDVAVLNPGVSLPLLIGGAVVSGIATTVTGVRSWRLHRQPLPEPAPKPVALPARTSAAREPMRRLGEAQETLHVLLEQLGGAALVPADDVAQARASGAAAATALHAISAQLQAVERARDHSPSRDRAPLSEGVRGLRRQLDEGVEGYLGLVSAAGRALAASTSSASHDTLTDASDRLSALAIALRDLQR
ncbi:phage shock envelope stress response protein PspM [Actinokineospora sp. G85]|uniref:phage shock envelope stress response protein PspM n=1 Tax=Actinokineospora sp. G85 TaxID=3406626 RepID=UPI003C77BE49